MDTEQDALSPEQRRRAAIRVTLIGSLLDLMLGVLKIVVGLFANSLALVSDGIHSLSDLLSDGFVLMLARVSHQAPDRKHPYGHGRFETVGTLLISVALFMVAGGILYDSLRRLSATVILSPPGLLAFLVALISVAGKEWIFQYTKRVAQRTHSSMLMANAWHSRSDALSSIVVLVGLLGVWLGYPWMDQLAAIVVALMIARIAWQLIASSFSEILDSALPPAELKEYRELVLSQPEIRGVHDLRGRRHGGQVLLDIHVQVDSRLSVSEGHFQGDLVSTALKSRFPAVSDVVIHVDPEFDRSTVSMDRPSRAQVEEALFTHWQGLLAAESCQNITLHYLQERVHVDLTLQKGVIHDAQQIALLRERVSNLPWLGQLRFHQNLETTSH